MPNVTKRVAAGARPSSRHAATAPAIVAQAVILMRDGQTLAAEVTRDVITDANLTRLYQTPVRVRELEGRLVVLSD